MIKYYSKETSHELNDNELKINHGKAEGVNIGNPVEVYRDEKERSVWSFALISQV
jgi:hypothetical protein